MKRKIFLWLPAIFWSGVIFYLSSLPIKPPTGTWIDRILPYFVHLMEYGVLFILVWRANKKIQNSFIICIVYALSDELHQIFVPTRQADPIDFLVDICGMMLAWIFIWKLLPKAPKKLLNLAKSWQII